MTIANNKINDFLNNKKITLCNLGKLMKFPEGALYDMVQGRRPFSEKLVKKLLPILEVSKEEFESWIVADKYPKELIIKAIDALKNRKYKRKRLLVQNLDRSFKEKNMSRSAFAKVINYDQPSFNKMINGQISLSGTVIKKTSEFFEIPEDEINAWVLADKYEFATLESALSLL